jgi:type III secretory pathway component EscR
MESRYLRCLLKWGFQLRLTPDDLRTGNIDLSSLSYLHPAETVHKLEAIYHLVYMIYLDEVVEDIELEVATIFAQTLGFKPSVVNELFKSIATEAYDETQPRDVKAEVVEFLKLNEV